jgi:hypothetical protein
MIGEEKIRWRGDSREHGLVRCRGEDAMSKKQIYRILTDFNEMVPNRCYTINLAECRGEDAPCKKDGFDRFQSNEMVPNTLGWRQWVVFFVHVDMICMT